CGEMWDARKVFDEMLERNSFTWATLISGYATGRVCGSGSQKIIEPKDHALCTCHNELAAQSPG
ncbi:pentatricopeptide repeat-containing protein, partial [Tanacetum coccineum]